MKRARPIKFVRARDGSWTWRASRPYRGVRIAIHKTCRYTSIMCKRIKTGSVRYYACLHRVGAARLGPESSHPAVFVNCAYYGQEYQSRATAQRIAVEWVDAGWPRASAETLRKWNERHNRGVRT